MSLRTTGLTIFLGASLLLAQGDFQKGIKYYKSGDYQKAIVEFEAIVKANPKYEDGFRLLGDCYLTLGKYSEAIARFREALKLRSDLFATYYGLAAAYYNSAKYSDAAATLQQGDRYLGNFDKYEFYHLRGSAFFNSRQYAAAITDLNQAVKVRPAKEDLLLLAQAHRQLGNAAESENAFRKVLGIDPGNVQAQEAVNEIDLKKAADLIEQKKFDEAKTLLSEFVKKNPTKGAGFYGLGLAYLYTKRFAEAEEALKNATLFSPTAAAFDNLGYVQEQQKKYEEAIASYKRAGQLGNTSAAQNIRRVRQLISQEKADTPP